MKEEKIQWILNTGTRLAILVGIQWLAELTVPYLGAWPVSLGCVFALCLWAGKAGVSSAGTVAVTAPFCAYVLGLGTETFAVVPAIALSNLVLVFLTAALLEKKKTGFLILKILGAACLYVFVLYCAGILVTVSVLGPSLPASQEEILRQYISWPLLISSAGGCGAACLLLGLCAKRKNKK